MYYFCHYGWLYAVRLVSSSWNCRSLQLSTEQPLPGQAVHVDRPSQYKSHLLGPSLQVEFGRTPGWVSSLRPSASVSLVSRIVTQRSSVLDSIWRMMGSLCLLFVSYRTQHKTVKFLRVIEGQLNKFSILLIAGAHIGAMALLVKNSYSLTVSLAYRRIWFLPAFAAIRVVSTLG